jgi:uncharacterized membrane protein SirB2
MNEYYPTIKLLHMSCAWLSISGFVLRGWWQITGSSQSGRRLHRLWPAFIDSCLLASALTLATLSDQWPLQQSWLTAKLFALVLYIGLGMVALHWGRNRREQAVGFTAALLVFTYIILVATQRSPFPAL